MRSTPRARAALGAVCALAVMVPAAASPAAAQTPAAATPDVLVSRTFPIDLTHAGLVDVQEGLRAGDFSSVRLTLAYLERIATLSAHGPSLNAVRAVNPSALREAAQRDRERRAGRATGSLHGIPVLVKDNIDVRGMPTTAGSVALARSYPADDAPLVKELREAGAIILGKTNLTEFANFMTYDMPNGYSSLGGQVLNPYDTSYDTSGSSSGSAVAAATALATVTIGTETSGSILSPARNNSNVGLKPTVGSSSRTGIVPISATQDTAGPMTRYVHDAAALFSAMVGTDPEDPATAENPFVGHDFTADLSTTALAGARLGYVASDNPLYLAALDDLRAEGATLVEVTVPSTSAPSVLWFEFKRDLESYLGRLGPHAPMRTLADIIAYNEAHAEVALRYGQDILIESQEIDLTDPETAAAYRAALSQGLDESRAAIDGVLDAHDLDAIVSASGTTVIGARAGYPSISVPAGYAEDRRPTNLVFLGTAWSEPTLIALASDYEDATRAWTSPLVLNPELFACSWLVRRLPRDAHC